MGRTQAECSRRWPAPAGGSWSSDSGARTCGIIPAAIRSAEKWISDGRAMAERSLDRLGEYPAATADQPEAPGDAREPH
jgi:hypothetical protein